MRSSTTLLLAAAATLASAHFDITYPAQRGNSHSSQGQAPCGGLNTPSKERTPWPLTGGRIEFKAGHDEAITEVRIAIGNDSDEQDDFDLVLAPAFNQVGFGNFCWNTLAVPAGAEGVRDGVNATIQIRQGGHGDGWLHNCADIVFSASAEVGSSCKNDTGISAEPVVGPTPPDGDDDDTDDNNDDDDDDDDDQEDNDTGAASSLTIASGAAVLGMAAGLLALF